MWKELIKKFTNKYEFFPGATSEGIRDAKDSISLDLPDELIDLLVESNGVNGEYGLGLIWHVGRIIEDNLRFPSDTDFKELYMPFDHYIPFIYWKAITIIIGSQTDSVPSVRHEA